MNDPEDDWILPPPPSYVDADHEFKGMDAKVVDYWRFVLGDLRMNNARGYLAEFIVARSLGMEKTRRVEWAEYDLEFEGITVEVKSSAYLQSWEQPRLSKIVFSGLKGTRFTPRDGYDPAGKQFNAMVYVFCLQSSQAHDVYDALDVDQWRFYVLPREMLVARGYASISLATLESLTVPRGAVELREAVRSAASPNL